MLQSYVKVSGPGNAIELQLHEASAMIGQLCNAITTVPPHARVEPPTPFVSPPATSVL